MAFWHERAGRVRVILRWRVRWAILLAYPVQCEPRPACQTNDWCNGCVHQLAQWVYRCTRRLLWWNIRRSASVVCACGATVAYLHFCRNASDARAGHPRHFFAHRVASCVHWVCVRPTAVHVVGALRQSCYRACRHDILQLSFLQCVANGLHEISRSVFRCHLLFRIHHDRSHTVPSCCVCATQRQQPDHALHSGWIDGDAFLA